MKQQDWIDFSKQLMVVIQVFKKWLKQLRKASLSRNSKQTVEVTETVSQKETVETKQDSEVVEQQNLHHQQKW